MMIGQGAIANVGQRYYLSGRGLAGNDPPVNTSVTKTPEYQAYKAKVDAATTLTTKLAVLAVADGFYNPTDPDTIPADLKARRVLTQNLIGDTCAALADGQDVACVLVVALNGVPDKTQYSFAVPTGANVQDLCTTQMTIDQALNALGKIDPDAAGVIAKGIYTAVPAKYADYKDWLWGRFKDRFTANLNPLENPLTSPLVKGVLIGLGLYLAISLLKK